MSERVVIVGAGAIGAGLGGLLQLAGVEVLLVARGAHAAAMKRTGLLLRTPTTCERLSVSVIDLSELELRTADQVWVCTKLNDTQTALAALQSRWTGQRVVSFQNGMAADPWYVAFGGDQTMVWMPAERLEPGVVDLHGIPIAGAIDVAEPEVATLLRRAGIRCTVRPDLDPWRRSKWITNLCGAAIGWGELDWVEPLQEEGRAVFAAAGLETRSDGERNAYVGDIGLAAIGGRERLQGGSTAQSLARGQPLEVPWLNGPIVALGQQWGVPTPYNRRVCERAGSHRP